MWGHTHWKRKFPQRKTNSCCYVVGEWMLGWQRPDRATVSKTEAVTIEIANHRVDGGPVGRGSAIQISVSDSCCVWTDPPHTESGVGCSSLLRPVSIP